MTTSGRSASRPSERHLRGRRRTRSPARRRRSRERLPGGRLQIGELSIDPVSRDVRVAGVRAALSQKEFALLLALAAHPVRVFTKEELLRTVWGYRTMGTSRH